MTTRDAAWLLAALGLAARGLAGGGDPHGAAALSDVARSESAGDLAHRAWLDAAREWSRVRPWQQGFAESRRMLDEIARARRAVADDSEAASTM